MNFDKYVGVPWRVGGRDLSGLDCWGLIWLFYRDELGIAVPSYGDAYAPDSDTSEIGALIKTQLPDWRQVETWLPGDVALINRRAQPCHVGIVAPRRRLLHVESADAGSVVEPIGASLQRRMIGVFRPVAE